MSGLAERVVELAADQLPEPERSRRSEEWAADLAGAKEHGLSRVGVALGALTFAIGAPVPNLVAADRWARWALAFAAIGPVALIFLQFSGSGFSNDWFKALVAIASIAALALVVPVALRTRGIPWRATGTALLLCLTALLWVAGNPGFPVDLRDVALVVLPTAAFVVVGLRMRAAGVSRAHRTAMFAFAALPVLNFVQHLLAWPTGWWVPIGSAGIALVMGMIVISRRSRGVHESTRVVRLASLALCVVAGAIVTVSAIAAITVATTDDSGPFMKSWAARAPEIMTSSIVIGLVAVAALGAFLILARVARRRGAYRAVGAIGLGLAAALAGVAPQVLWLIPWDTAIPLVVGAGFAVAGCVLVGALVILLVAPLSRTAYSDEAPG